MRRSFGLLLLGVLLAACTGASASSSPFVGHWTVDGFDGMTVTFNSDGRVRVLMADGSACVGGYTVDEAAATVAIDYDDGQASCYDMTSPYTFATDDELRFGALATYRRTDREDETPL